MKSNRFFKSVMLICSALVTLVVLFACSNGGTKSSGTTINFWHHYSAQSKENEILTKVLIPQFEKENPGIKINAVSHEWKDLHDKILVSANSKTLPDVARLDLAWIPEFQSGNLLEPVNKEFTDFNKIEKTILENAMNTTKMGNDYFGLPLNINTKILFYNKKALEEKNINAPETLEQFIQAAKQLAGKNKQGQQVFGYTEPGLAAWNLAPFIWSNGGDILSPDQKKATGYLNSKQNIELIQKFKELASENVITGWNSGDIPATDGFASGRYMMLLDGPWKISELKEGYPDFEYGVVKMPKGAGGSHSVIGGESISVFSSTKQKEAAWKFAKFMTSDFAQKEMTKAGQLPVNKSVLESDEMKKSHFAPFIDALKEAKARPNISKWTDIDDLLSTTITNIMKDNLDVKTELDKLAEKIDQILEK